jgi:hypothetical protein
MSNVGSKIGLVGGGIALLAVTYFGVVLAKGASPRTIPPVSWFVPPPHDDVAAESADHEAGTVPGAEPLVVQRPPVSPMTAGVLGAFVLPSPFDSRELHDVQKRIAERVAALDAREIELDRRARELDDWQRTLDQRVKEIAALRDGSAVPPRAETPVTASQDAAGSEAASWRSVAPLFQDGDPEEVAAKLAEFTPEEAASILKGLEADRAVELLNALPKDRYKPFLDAWRKAKD